MYRLISAVEESFMKLVNDKEIFLRDSFEVVLNNLCNRLLPKIGCEQHHKVFISDVIYQYLLVRFRCIAKREKRLIEEEKTEKHKEMKSNTRRLSYP